ncbi:MAG: DNA repair protein RecN, partial [Acidimicrobiales bacterium]
RVTAEAALLRAREHLGLARRAAAPTLAAGVEAQLATLAMPQARFAVEVGDDPAAAAVTWMLAANAGEPLLPLAKVASGGELARTMLALRLVLSGVVGADEGGRTLVFDEVDAGIGGEAAVAVGRALAAVARHHQVLVVTHLPQVAAFADHHLAVTKSEQGRRAIARADPIDGPDRVVELSRMLSGRPQSATARRHAEELLEIAARPSPGSAGSAGSLR